MRSDVVGVLVPLEKLLPNVVRQEDLFERGTTFAQRDECIEWDIAVCVAQVIDIVGGGKAWTRDRLSRKHNSLIQYSVSEFAALRTVGTTVQQPNWTHLVLTLLDEDTVNFQAANATVSRRRSVRSA